MACHGIFPHTRNSFKRTGELISYWIPSFSQIERQGLVVNFVVRSCESVCNLIGAARFHAAEVNGLNAPTYPGSCERAWERGYFEGIWSRFTHALSGIIFLIALVTLLLSFPSLYIYISLTQALTFSLSRASGDSSIGLVHRPFVAHNELYTACLHISYVFHMCSIIVQVASLCYSRSQIKTSFPGLHWSETARAVVVDYQEDPYTERSQPSSSDNLAGSSKQMRQRG